MKADMIALPGGVFWMGSDDHYPEEAPARRVRVDPFDIDVAPVTNRAFAAFVADTGYVTLAEKGPDARDYPNADPAMLKPGSSVFTPSPTPIENLDAYSWWRFEFGACWRRPLGRGSDLDGLDEHPAVHIAYQDAEAYAAWAGKDLPTEAEWEYATRGGLERAEYAWGDELHPGGRMMANTWQGAFPYTNTLDDGYAHTSPVGAFLPNFFGLLDMIGNVWEWTSDWYSDRQAQTKACCIPSNPRGGDEQSSRDAAGFGRKVLKGGSHLCAPSYCRRYRPAARYPQSVDTSTSHIGFRCVRRVGRANPR